jgi:glycosyltransferase involved in cell wall biosynthesis
MRTWLQTGGNFKSTTLAVPGLSIILPVLNEADIIADALAALAPLRQRGAEVIVADGGSRDATLDLARAGADRVIVAPRGRATQMNAGAALARGDVLIFLHADTRLPVNADALVLEALKRSGRSWGRFDIAIIGRSALLAIVARTINLRSRLSGIRRCSCAATSSPTSAAFPTSP